MCENSNDQIQTLFSALQSAQKKNKEAEAEISLLRKKLEIKEKELDDLRESKDKLRDHLMEGNIRIYDRESEKIYTIDEQEKEIHGLKNEIFRYKKQITDLQEYILELEKLLEEKDKDPKWERLQNAGKNEETK